MYIRTEARLSKRPWGIDRKERGALDHINEELAGYGKTLHPTKGFRRINAKSILASMITNALKAGRKSHEVHGMRNALYALIKGQ